MLQFLEKSNKYTEPITVKHFDDIENFSMSDLHKGEKKSIMIYLTDQVFDSLTQETV